MIFLKNYRNYIMSASESGCQFYLFSGFTGIVRGHTKPLRICQSPFAESPGNDHLVSWVGLFYLIVTVCVVILQKYVCVRVVV